MGWPSPVLGRERDAGGHATFTQDQHPLPPRSPARAQTHVRLIELVTGPQKQPRAWAAPRKSKGCRGGGGRAWSWTGFVGIVALATRGA